jgi:hypothetical protein
MLCEVVKGSRKLKGRSYLLDSITCPVFSHRSLKVDRRHPRSPRVVPRRTLSPHQKRLKLKKKWTARLRSRSGWSPCRDRRNPVMLRNPKHAMSPWRWQSHQASPRSWQ